MASFRGLLRFMAPKWLAGDVLPDGTETESRTLYSIFVVMDALSERLRLGMLAQYPDGNEPADALTEIGRDRRIIRGPAEPAASFEARCRTARTDWKRAGNAWAMLSQIQGFFSPAGVKVAAVTNSGKWYELAADGTKTTTAGTAWDWDGDTASWARFWIIIYCSAGVPFAPEDTWADAGTYDDGGTWDTDATPEEAQGVRRIVSDWLMAGSRCVNVIIAFDEATFVPGSGEPDGTWAAYGDPATSPRITGRDATASYWHGTGP
jgi:hypothetical protein